MTAKVLAPRSVGNLIDALRDDGYSVLGPRVADGAIVIDEIEGVDDLPVGWTEVQEAGRYRLARRDDQALFGHVVGPHSWKAHLFPPRETLWRARRTDDGFEVAAEELVEPRRAFLGVRGCDLAAIEIQDRVWTGDTVDGPYAARRRSAFLVAVECAVAGGTCFCTSMGTGPAVADGFDLVLTEVLEGDDHFLVARPGSQAGRLLLEGLEGRPATAVDLDRARAGVERAARSMGRTLETDGIRELLQRNLDHPRWDDVASRCLSCTNCTLVCPTCFCHSVEDVTDLTGDAAERVRLWDSCFTMGHSYLAGGQSVHATIKSRYRQWLTHKLASWIDQFGTSGCVGCGRCITWCPTAIDLTEEVAAIRSTDAAEPPR